MHASIPKALTGLSLLLSNKDGSAPPPLSSEPRRAYPQSVILVHTASPDMETCTGCLGDAEEQRWVEFLEEINAGLGPCEVRPSESEIGEEEVFQAEGTPCIISQKGESLLWEFQAM